MIVFVVVILLLVCLCILFLFVTFTYDSLRISAPTIFSSKKAIDDLFNQVAFPKDSIFLDIGSGDGRVVQSFLKKNEGKGFGKAIGIEKGVVSYWLSRLRVRSPRVQFFLLDAFDARALPIYQSSTHIFMYLYPEMMEKLLPILKKKAKKGTIVMSLDFEIKGLVHERVLMLQNEGKFYSFGRKVYFYKL